MKISATMRKKMGKTGRRFMFHGAFNSKERARKKEKKVRGFIKAVKIKGHRRFVVMTRKRG